MKSKIFTAILVKDLEPGGWTKIDIPFDVQTVFGSKGFVQVKGTIDNVPFDNIKIMPVGNGQHQMAISEKLRKAISKGNGDAVSIRMEIDNEELVYAEPADFILALHQVPLAEIFYTELSAASKKWYIMHILEAKQENTRKTRITKAIARLKEGRKFHD